MKPVKFLSKGIVAVPFAPFQGSSGENLNLTVIPEYAQYYAENGFKIVIINGSYGEGMSMTTDERMRLANAWSEAVKHTGQELIIHVGGTNLKEVKKLAIHAQNINASAIICLPELYYKPKKVEDLIDYLAEVGASAPIVPLFYYHSPSATGVDLSMAELFEKVENKVPTFGGIKFTCTKLDELVLAVKAAGDRFRVIVSDNFIIPASVAIGVDTFMPTIMNLAPHLVNSVYKSAIAGDFSTVQVSQLKLTNMIEKLAAIDKNVMPVMKAVSRCLLLPKIDIGTTRKPLMNYDSMVETSQLAYMIASQLV